MNSKYTYKTKGFSKIVWGLLLFLSAAFIIANQIGGFIELGFWSVLVGTLALAYSLACLFTLKIAWLPLPLAVLYIVVQSPLNLPEISTWVLILSAILASVGLSILLPKRLRNFTYVKKSSHFGAINQNDYKGDGEVKADYEIGGDQDYVKRDDYDNNPSVSVKFGGESRYLHADALETVNLNCEFGGLQVYFDQARLSPNGATAYCNCSFGEIKLFIPKHWKVIDEFSVSLGAADIDRRRNAPTENAPVLRIIGNVSLGAINVNFI